VAGRAGRARTFSTEWRGLVCACGRDPIVTGSSVLAIKYRGGVLLMADTFGSYGSLARFTDLRRLRPVGRGAILGASGEISDFQHILTLITELEYVSPAPASPPFPPPGVS
jgi:20S proteasome alpha/beta subunit